MNIDNNRAECLVHPIVIGRKAKLFANVKTGATASTTLYRMVETGKINGLAPHKYLIKLLANWSTADTPEVFAVLEDD